jgi:hypothetical protein
MACGFESHYRHCLELYHTWMLTGGDGAVASIYINNLVVTRHFRNKKKEYVKGKINELAPTVRTKTSETCIEE